MRLIINNNCKHNQADNEIDPSSGKAPREFLRTGPGQGGLRQPGNSSRIT